MGMSLQYENLDFAAEDEISLGDVIRKVSIPRRTLLRYASRFREFVPSSVRRPPLDIQQKRGRHRVLYFKAGAVDVLPFIRELSRSRLPYGEIVRVLKKSKGQILATRVQRKIAPFIEVLKGRKNSFPGLSKLPEDFDFAPLAKAVEVIEEEFSVQLPVDVRGVGEDKYERLLFQMNALFLFHLQENLNGSELEIRIRDYLKAVHVTTAQEEKLRDWLGERLGLAGRWAKKNRLVVDQLAYELIQHGGMTYISVRELFERCHKRIMVTHLVEMPVVGVPEIRNSWLLLIEAVMRRRKLVVKSSVTDTDSVVNVIVSDWKQRWEDESF